MGKYAKLHNKDDLIMNEKDDHNSHTAVLQQARRVLRIEAEAIEALGERINRNFTEAVDVLDQCEGKVIVIGIGKSGIVSQKLASTFACTGTPAFFRGRIEYDPVKRLSRGIRYPDTG